MCSGSTRILEMSKRKKTPTKDSKLKRDLGTTLYRQRVKPDKKHSSKRKRNKQKEIEDV